MRAARSGSKLRLNHLRFDLAQIVCLTMVACSLTHAGCANWSNETRTATKLLSPPAMSPDSLIIEATLIRFPEDRWEQLAAIWNVIDESIIDLETRRRLDENGLRCGVLVSEMPQLVRERLKELAGEENRDPLEQAGLAADVTSDTHRLQCRAGRRKELPIRTELSEPLTVVYKQAGSIRGNVFDRPSLMFDLRAIPHGDGRAILSLTPEIQHGEHRKSFAHSQSGVRPEVKRQSHSWDDLAIEATLTTGQALMVTLTDQPKGLGQAFFTTRTAEQSQERVLLVIRLMSNQLNELFAPEQVEAAKLAAER